MWKHGMVREDFSHYSQLLDFVIVFWGLIVLALPKTIHKMIYFVPLLSILAIHVNGDGIKDYKENYHVNIVGINKMNPYLFSYQNHVHQFYQNSLTNVEINKVADSLRQVIGDKTIDIYPWDLSYIPANNFNWKPRKTLQSIGFSNWQDEIDSKNFTQKNGPDFILFHTVKDTFESSLGSIDFRYLLNDEPLTNIQIFTNYKICYINDAFTLFKKTNLHNLKNQTQLGSVKIKWGEWIDCPKIKNVILKAKVFSQKTILGDFKQFFYKDVEYYIEYETNSSEKLKYRYIPSIAKNGLWINPFIRSFNKKIPNLQISKIRFSTNSTIGINKDIMLQWEIVEQTEVNDSILINDLFH